MSLAPRVVVVHRASEYDELLSRHGTRGQSAFFLATRGRDIEELEARHRVERQALDTVTGSIPLDWRRGKVERSDLDRFIFAPDDLVVVVGQDGLVANVAKYLDAQPVIVATGTGATGWCRSIWAERRSALRLPAPTDRALTWFVREAWPSPTTGNAQTEGTLDSGELLLTVESDHLVVFGDGMESDFLPLSWGQTLRVGISERTLRLVV